MVLQEDRWLAATSSDPASAIQPAETMDEFEAVIGNDQQYFSAEGLQRSTATEISGPGSTAVAAHFADRTPTV